MQIWPVSLILLLLFTINGTFGGKWPYKKIIYKNKWQPPLWKLPEWAENQRFGGEGTQQQVPKRTELNEPELAFFGYVDPSTFAPLISQPSENELEPVCKDFRFDIRQRWPECAEIISHISDQSLCSSCYALSTAAAFSDRHCILLAKSGLAVPNGKDGLFSATDVMDCVRAGSENACNGGYSSRVWRWFTEVGVVRNSCKSYPIPSNKDLLVSSGAKCNEWVYPAMECPRKCSNPAYGREYGQDKTMALNYNVLGTLEGQNKSWNYYKPLGRRWFSWEQTMKEQLQQNGSITVDFVVYEDFFDYPNNLGIYKHVHGAEQYAHVVRLIGYGRVDCSDGRREKYWLGANTWGSGWGEQGTFRMARGRDECGMESRQIGFGTPKL